MNDFNTNVPIYLQIIEDIKSRIMNGTLKPNDKIPSVREFALEFGVNPNTIQRAFTELERDGYIRTERAVGRYVNDNQELIDFQKQKYIQENIEEFVEKMESLGLSLSDIQKALENYKEDIS